MLNCEWKFNFWEIDGFWVIRLEVVLHLSKLSNKLINGDKINLTEGIFSIKTEYNFRRVHVICLY